VAYGESRERSPHSTSRGASYPAPQSRGRDAIWPLLDPLGCDGSLREAERTKRGISLHQGLFTAQGHDPEGDLNALRVASGFDFLSAETYKFILQVVIASPKERGKSWPVAASPDAFLAGVPHASLLPSLEALGEV
jgi:hypothetical protein